MQAVGGTVWLRVKFDELAIRELDTGFVDAAVAQTYEEGLSKGRDTLPGYHSHAKGFVDDLLVTAAVLLRIVPGGLITLLGSALRVVEEIGFEVETNVVPVDEMLMVVDALIAVD